MCDIKNILQNSQLHFTAQHSTQSGDDVRQNILHINIISSIFNEFIGNDHKLPYI